MNKTKIFDKLKDYFGVIFVNLITISLVSFVFHTELVINQRIYFSGYCIAGYLVYLCWYIGKEVKARSHRLYQQAYAEAENNCKKRYDELLSTIPNFPLQVTDELKIYCIELIETKMFFFSSWNVVGEYNGELFAVDLFRQYDETLNSIIGLLREIAEPTDIIEMDLRYELNINEAA
jgi:hypothetical protein